MWGMPTIAIAVLIVLGGLISVPSAILGFVGVIGMAAGVK